MEFRHDEWAVVCTIRQDPDYTFVGSELRHARRMAAAGWLEEKAGRRFAVTPTGERAYLRHAV